MNRKRMYIAICLILMVGLIIIAVFQNKRNLKQSSKINTTEHVKDDSAKTEDYIDNKMESVPIGYLDSVKKGGTIKKIEYATKNYGPGEKEEYNKNAMVYLPYGYDETDKNKKYDILYLMHGGGDDEYWYFGDGSYESSLKCILDHMITNGDIPPCIVCTPTYQNSYLSNESESVKYFCEEFKNDLMPAVEGKYNTYYEADSVNTSRWHRGFSGFSMGAATTWWIFEKCMDEVAYFIPISGDSWCGGSNGTEKVKHLSEVVKKQGYSSEDFKIFYSSGDVNDIAYEAVSSQVQAMKVDEEMFQYCDNYESGNFFYEKKKDGGHDINTVYDVVYSGMQRLFARTKTTEQYYLWSENKMSDKEPAKIAKYEPNYYYGKIKKYQYYSTTAKRKTNVNVFLPPNYSKDETYPVLYLLHGYYDNEDWMAEEMVELKKILSNLINQGEARDMIVVMPYIFCSPEMEVCTGMDLQNSLCYDNFVNDLITDLMPFIEEKFSVATGRENTAITGFSMGGRESLFIGITHPEIFGYVGAVCPAPGLTPGNDLNQHPGQLKEDELTFSEENNPYLMLLSAAKEDGAVGNNPEIIHNILVNNGVKHLWNVIPDGGHDASSVRVHLYNYFRMIFRYKK